MLAASFAQVGIGTTNPHPSASLELNSNSGGLLINRITEAQRLAITNPAAGLLVYQTDSKTGFWYWNGTIWIQLSYLDTQGSITHNYGVMSNYANGSTITVTGQSGVWMPYQFSTNPGNFVTLQSGCVSATPGPGSNFTVTQNGVYRVIVCISLLNASSADAVNFTVFRNGLPLNYLSAQFNVPTGGDAYGSATLSSIVALNANDYLELYFKQITGGGNRTFDVGTITFTLVRFD